MTAPKRRRPLEIIVAGDGDYRHGRLTTYSYHGCHCDLCRDAWNTYHRELRARRQKIIDGGAA